MSDFNNVFGEQIATPKGRFVFFDLVDENTQAKHPKNKFPSDRFDVTMIFEPSADLSKLKEACEKVAKQAFKDIKGVEMPFANGDEKKMACMKGHIVIRSKSKKRPGLVDDNGDRMTSEDEIRAGMWGRLIVSPFSYTSGRTKGITLLLKKAKVFLDQKYESIGSGTDIDFDDDAKNGDDSEGF